MTVTAETTQPGTQMLHSFVELLRKNQTKPKATVESEPDPSTPGRTRYRITGRSCAAVQVEIDALMARVERVGGFANFIGPRPIDGGMFGALGEVVITQPHSVAVE